MQVIQGMMEQLTKNMQTMSEQMSHMARKVEQLEMDKLNQAGSNIDNMKGKGKEIFIRFRCKCEPLTQSPK